MRIKKRNAAHDIAGHEELGELSGRASLTAWSYIKATTKRNAARISRI